MGVTMREVGERSRDDRVPEYRGRGKGIREEKEERDIRGNLLSSGQVWNNKQK
jgi:hypothetical protein